MINNLEHIEHSLKNNQNIEETILSAVNQIERFDLRRVLDLEYLDSLWATPPIDAEEFISHMLEYLNCILRTGFMQECSIIIEVAKNCGLCVNEPFFESFNSKLYNDLGYEVKCHLKNSYKENVNISKLPYPLKKQITTLILDQYYREMETLKVEVSNLAEVTLSHLRHKSKNLQCELSMLKDSLQSFAPRTSLVPDDSSQKNVNSQTKEDSSLAVHSESFPGLDILGVSNAVCGSANLLGIGAILRGISGIFGMSKKKNNESLNVEENVVPKVKSKIEASVYSPAEVERDSHMIIQVYLYQAKDQPFIAALATEIDPDAKRRNYTPLTQTVSTGDNIKICLKAYGDIEIEKNSFETIWRNELVKHEFALCIPKDFNKSNFLCAISIFINNVPVGDMKFKTNIVDFLPRRLWAEVRTHKFEKTFISYSHKDIGKIRFLAEGFKVQGINYFFDEHSLRTGDDYPAEIDNYISSCDLFVLCWSENAMSSAWVEREYKRALNRYNLDHEKIHIYPISVTPQAPLPTILSNKFHIGYID